MENTTTAVVPFKIEEAQSIIATAPVVFAENKNSREKAIERYNLLKKIHSENGMSYELDKQIASFIEKASKTIKVMNERRKPFSQTIDAIKKEFTTMEGELKTVTEELQGYRNTYAKAKVEEQKKREREAQKKLDIEKEKIRIKAVIETSLSSAYQAYLYDRKSFIGKLLEGAKSADQLEPIRKAILDIPSLLTKELYLGLIKKEHVVYDKNLVLIEDFNAICDSVLNDELVYQTTASDFNDNITAYKKQTIDLIPSKKTELEQIAAASEVERKRLEKEAQERAAQEAEKLAQEAKENAKKAEELTAAKSASEVIDAVVSQQATLFDEPVKVKTGTEIVLKNKAAYALIFQFWFEKEGKLLDAEKIERKTIKQMKSFCEEHTLKTGESINSPFIEYKDTYKAK